MELTYSMDRAGQFALFPKSKCLGLCSIYRYLNLFDSWTQFFFNDSSPGMEHTQVDSAGQVSGENRADRRGKEHVQGIESPKDD